MDNLKLWDAVADIDPKFTKAITGKPYKGTSPNPHYLIKLATEHLGPVGHGFGWSVQAEGFETMGDTVLHWCRIRFWWVDPSDKMEPGHGFEAYGQTKAAFMTRGGSFTVDEDAPKKSMTDAVTKALAQIGFAANIYLGRWDDSKYVENVAADHLQRKRDGDKEAFAKRCVKAAQQAAGMKGRADLEAAFRSLKQNDPDVAADESVVRAYRDRANELTPKEDAA